jgi:hypothetical protein
VRKQAGSNAQQKRLAQAAAKKQRRQKVIAFGGLGVLAILMFIQGPKLLNAFGGTDASTAGAADVPVAPVASRGKDRRALRLVKASGADPFAYRSLADNDPRAGSVLGPGGTHDPFAPDAASRAARPLARPLPGRIVVGTPRRGAVAKRGWIVVLASVQTRVGRAYAERFARGARRNGLRSISVLSSSTRKPLRAGYYVVYTGPFRSLSAVQRSAARVRARGYGTAYVRQLLRY